MHKLFSGAKYALLLGICMSLTCGFAGERPSPIGSSFLLKKGGNRIRLFGEIHDHALSDELGGALVSWLKNESSVFYIEIVDPAADLSKVAFHERGGSARDDLGDQLFERVVEKIQSLRANRGEDLKSEGFLYRLKPIFLFNILLDEVELKSSIPINYNIDYNKSITAHVIAARGRNPIHGLESRRDRSQMGGSCTLQEWRRLFNMVLNSDSVLAISNEYLNEYTRIIDGRQKIDFSTNLIESWPSIRHEVMDRCYVRSANERWVDKLDSNSKVNPNQTAVFGVAHLYGGLGVVSLLISRGWELIE